MAPHQCIEARVEDVIAWLVRFALLCLLSDAAHAHDASTDDQRLSEIGPAPDFTLTSQNGALVSLRDFRGKVVVVTFIYTSCTDVCPILTNILALVQNKLGSAFGTRVVFASITVDPERDTPDVLTQYSQNFGANLGGWTFLTGSLDKIDRVAREYGVIVRKRPGGDIDHTLLTSLIDSKGVLRVQYLGVRFDTEEFRRDLLSLSSEPN